MNKSKIDSNLAEVANYGSVVYYGVCNGAAFAVTVNATYMILWRYYSSWNQIDVKSFDFEEGDLLDRSCRWLQEEAKKFVDYVQ